MRLPAWLIKLGFHLLYYQLAWTYDLVAWSVSFGQWAAWRRLALKFLRSGRTLELAYGTGGFFVDMLEAGHNPVGVDLSPFMARIAAQRLTHNHYALRLNRARAQALPFPSNYFDNVVATFPTDYMLAPETLSEISRVLRSSSVPDVAWSGEMSTSEEDNLPGRLVIVAEGELRGPWPLRPLIDWLYKITDQRKVPPARPLNLLKAHNFQARWKRVEHEGVVARLLIGDKLD